MPPRSFSWFQLVRAKVHWHLCTHLHCYSFFWYQDKKGFQSHIHFTKVLRETQIRSVHEMGEMKRAQELRVDEVSVQKLMENHETFQKLTSQLQEMQERVNSMNDWGEFQEVESNHS